MSSDREPAPFGGQWIPLSETDRALWHPDTGRWMRLHEDTLISPPPPALAARLRALGFIDFAPAERFPARSRWALLLPERAELWHACPLDRSPGGLPFRAMPLEEDAIALWRACDGRHTLRQITQQLQLPMDAALTMLGRWTAADVQAAQLRARPVRNREPGLAHLLTRERPAHTRENHHYQDGATTLDEYHHSQITDGQHHFDDREITFAHSFERPHPALHNRPFGEALRRGLKQRHIHTSGSVLEIGPGTGALSAAFTASDPPAQYTRLDLSPELLRIQEQRSPATRSLLGSATQIPLEEHSVDLVLSNEVIADLRAAPSPEGWPITPAAGQRLFNTGAWAMLKEVARVLRPGGWAYISEFGAIDELPEETTHLDHPEVSIHFGQLQTVAESVGLVSELIPMDELLSVNREAVWLSRASTEALRALHHRHGGRFTAHARTPEQIALPWEVEGLWWVPVTDPGCAPILDRLWVLLAYKPHLSNTAL